MIRKYAVWLVFIIAIAVLIGVFGFNRFKISEHNNRPITQKETLAKVPEVSVIPVTSGSYSIDILGYAAVKPHYELALVSGVNGMVEAMNELFESGLYIRKNDVILTLESSDYANALASAEESLASSQVNLYEMQREALQAQAEWKDSGMQGQPDSPLVLWEPQLKAAKASVNAAEKAVSSARKNLDLTKVKAPFDALVVSRNVSPGSYIQSSTEIATLYSTDYFEIFLSLSKKELIKLPKLNQKNANLKAVFKDVESRQEWTGYVKRLEQSINESNRQQTLVLAVDNPLKNAQGLVPGAFVEVNIQGREIDNLWRLPSSSLSQRGQIWYVDDDVMHSFSADILASDQTYIYVQPPVTLKNKMSQILLHPLSSYLSGMRVKPLSTNQESLHE